MSDDSIGSNSAKPTSSSADAVPAQPSKTMEGASTWIAPANTPSPHDGSISGDRDTNANVNDSVSFNFLASGPQPPALDLRLAVASRVADPSLRQAVEANVRLQTQRETAAFTDGQRQAKSQAKALIDQGGDLSSIPAKLLLQIDVPGRQALLDYATAHGNPVTDPVIYYGLKNHALDDPAGFQTVDLTNHMAKLNAADFRDLQQLQKTLKSSQPPADLPLQQAYKANTDRLLQQLGLPTGLDTEPTTDKYGQQQAIQLRQAADLHLAANEFATGRKMTLAEHRTMLREIAFQQVLPATPSVPLPAAVAGGSSALDAAPALLPEGVATAGGIGAGEEAVAGAAAMGLGPLALLTAAILAATTTRTAGRALDEYQAPVKNDPSRSGSVVQPQVLQRATPKDEEEDADCEDERRACTKLCLDALTNPKMKNIYSNHFLKCFKGCVPARCGGNPI